MPKTWVHNMSSDFLFPILKQRGRRNDEYGAPFRSACICHMGLEPYEEGNRLKGLSQTLFVGVEYARKPRLPGGNLPMEPIDLMCLERSADGARKLDRNFSSPFLKFGGPSQLVEILFRVKNDW